MLEIHSGNIKRYSKNIIEHNITDDAKVVEAFDEKEEVIGHAIYVEKEDIIEIYEVDCNPDLYLYDGIVRTILFKGMLKGINKAEYNLKDMTKIYKLRLSDKDSNKLSSIESIMNSCKNCKNYN